MAISLAQFMKERSSTSLVFVNAEKVVTTRKVDEQGQETEAASFYLELELRDPIEVVTGKTAKYVISAGERLSPTAFDVTKVRVHYETLLRHETEFTYQEEADGKISGEYKGDCFLDVSENEDVWLCDDALANYGKKKRAQARDQKADSIKAKLEALKRKKKGGDNPEEGAGVTA